MKLRINGNSLRLRLSKSEVNILAETGIVQSDLNLGTAMLKYRLQSSEVETKPAATFDNQTINIYLPASFAKEWPENQIVGIDGFQAVSESEDLYILVEKDFKCMDNSTEDQSDNYDNPKAC